MPVRRYCEQARELACEVHSFFGVRGEPTDGGEFVFPAPADFERFICRRDDGDKYTLEYRMRKKTVFIYDCTMWHTRL